MCTAANACMGAALACTGTADCPQGDVCCGMLMAGRGSSTCQAMCMGGTQLCQGASDCPSGDRCAMGGGGGFGICLPGGFDGGFPRDAAGD
jgi:hypothetical protein